MKKYLGLIGTLALSLCMSTAGASTLGVAEARLSLLLPATPVDGVNFSSFTFLPFPDNPPESTYIQDLNSSAVVYNRSLTGVEPLSFGDQVSADVRAGSGAKGPLGFSSGFIQSGVALEVTNTSGSFLSLGFLFDLELSSSAQATDPLLEYSFAFAGIFATITEGGITTALFQAFSEADTDFGPLNDDIPSSQLQFSMDLFNGESQTIGLMAWARVESASLVVPIPPALFLLLQALGCLSIFRIAKRAAGRAPVTPTDGFRTHS